MENYIKLQQTVLQKGCSSPDRTGTGTTRAFALNRDLRFDLSKRFPAPTTKKLAERAVFGEALWFMTGSDTIPELKFYTFGDHQDSRNTIWCSNYAKQGMELGYQNGYCGEVYGVNWRRFGESETRVGVDQLQNVIDEIKINPTSRRLVIYTNNPNPIYDPILPPCHDFFQFFVEDGKLSMDVHMR